MWVSLHVREPGSVLVHMVVNNRDMELRRGYGLALHGLDKSTNKQLSHVPSNSAPACTGAGTGLGVGAEGGAALATGAKTLGGLEGPVTVVEAA